ncbi:MAG: OmpA family protein [Betaproteobacteria bacterium]
MRPKTNRLLMLLVGAVISSCASQTDRSSSGAGAQTPTEAVAPQPAPPPAYEPTKESVQIIDRPLEVTAPKKNEATPDFPVTKYALPEEQAQEEIGDLGPQEDESMSAKQGAAPAQESSVGETTEYADADQEEEEIGDLGPQEDESVSEQQGAAPAQESSVGKTTGYADSDQEDEVGDLGTQPDDSGTVRFPEEKRAAAEQLVGEPKIYPDEPAPKIMSVNFDAEPLFGFDKSEIRGDQRAKLDELISGLNGAKYDSITVVGYADRIGKDAYNQKLSERRAEAVRAYLARKGIPSDKIQTEGRGASEPVTGDTCNKIRGKALISCLQPDRRVDVGASATKISK